MTALGITPGPWLVHATARLIVPAADAFKTVTRKGNREVDFETDEAPNSIALLRDCDDQMTEDESLANGFLIAAAPELYRELDRMTDLLRHALATPGYGRDENSAEEAADHLEAADAALAKARGKVLA